MKNKKAKLQQGRKWYNGYLYIQDQDKWYIQRYFSYNFNIPRFDPIRYEMTGEEKVLVLKHKLKSLYNEKKKKSGVKRVTFE